MVSDNLKSYGLLQVALYTGFLICFIITENVYIFMSDNRTFTKGKLKSWFMSTFVLNEI